ncbi:hypothetical protein EON81_15975 [bacterium]|nr:MAG: hypothetical protein EON81_15975 [bacterium]
MSHRLDNPSESLSRATQALRNSSLRQDALDRAEDAILAHVPVRSKTPSRLLLWAAGFGAAALAAAFVLMPAQTSAAEMMRIAAKGDIGLRHMRTFRVEPNGKLLLTSESFTDGAQTRMIDAYGNQYAYGKGRIEILHAEGGVTVERQPRKPEMMNAPSATELLKINFGQHPKISLEKDVLWEGRNVDRHTIDTDNVDGRGKTLRLHLTMVSDPESDRPLEMRAKMEGFQASVTRWDYPASNPGLLKLPIPKGTPVFDLNEQRAEILEAVASKGRRATVGGQSVELLQLWADATGRATAIARADYAYPYDHGLEIEGMKLATEPKSEPFSGRYAIVKPHLAKGRPIQLFTVYRTGNHQGVKFADSVTVRLPVFRGEKLLGYARFKDVPVHRAWSVPFLLEPMNQPFWLPNNGGNEGQETVAAEES